MINEKEMIKYIKKNNLAVHCPSEEEYNTLVNILKKNKENVKEDKYLLDIANELNIENYELKLKLDDSYEVVRCFKSINKSLERILEIAEKNLVKKDIEIEILKNKGK